MHLRVNYWGYKTEPMLRNQHSAYFRQFPLRQQVILSVLEKTFRTKDHNMILFLDLELYPKPQLTISFLNC